MKLYETKPMLHGVRFFKYAWQERKNPKIAFPKTQYTYRFIYIVDGKVNVCIDNQIYNCTAGDMAYLLPGCVYRLEPCESDFSIYSTFFDFLPNCHRRTKTTAACVFVTDYACNLCSEVISFDDAPELDKSRVYKNIGCGKGFVELLAIDRADEAYDFYGRTAIDSVISCMLLSVKHSQRGNPAAERILSYIRCNPDKDLSAGALAEHFSYHKNYINQLLRQATGKTLQEHVRNAKIEHARALLSEGGASMSQIAQALGYYDYSHFYKAFLAETGMTPSEYLLSSGVQN